MNKTNLRLLSKISLLLVIIGFFMPVSCNLNLFQIANAEGSLGLNFISVSLYSVFIFSCIGFLSLFVLLLSQKKYSITYDWINMIIIVFSFLIFVAVQTHYADDLPTWITLQLQYGAYIIILGILVSFVSLVFATFSKNEKNTAFTIGKKTVPPENNIVACKDDEYLLETSDNRYPDSFYNDKKKYFYAVTGLNIKEAVTVKKILAFAEKTPSFTVKDIVKNTDIKLEEAEDLLPELVSAGFVKTENGADGISTYTFEINSAEKRILDIAENKFPLTLEDIIKTTELEIKEINTTFTKLLKVGFFIKCGNKVITEPNKEAHIDTVYYYVFSELKNIEAHLQYLIDEDKTVLVNYLINALPMSIDFEPYLISLLKDNRTAFANSLYEYSGLSKILSINTPSGLTDLYIRKLGYLHIKQGSEKKWNKKITKLKTISYIIIFLFIIFVVGPYFVNIFINKVPSFISWLIMFCSLFFVGFVIGYFAEKSEKKYLNKLFEIPDDKKNRYRRKK